MFSMISNVFNARNSKETSWKRYCACGKENMNHGDSDKYLKDKIALLNDDKITEINIFICFVFSNPILLPQR